MQMYSNRPQKQTIEEFLNNDNMGTLKWISVHKKSAQKLSVPFLISFQTKQKGPFYEY